MKRIIYRLSLFLVILSSVSCKKQEGFGPLTDTKTDIPVTVANMSDFLLSPVVKASKAENKIVITLQIPANSGRTIKEITKVAAAATSSYTAIQTSTVGTSALYTNTPIPASGTSATFTTTFDEYKTKTGVTAVPTSNALLTRDFYFQITLDNGQTIYTTMVRV